MAKIEVSADLVADLLFACSDNPVEILDAGYSPLSRSFEFEIEGYDVPRCKRVAAAFTVQTNCVGQRLHRVEFKPA